MQGVITVYIVAWIETAEKKMNYTYILQCADHTLYCGWTNHLEKRLKAHNDGKGAKYTKARRPVLLVYYEEFPTKEEAMRREAAIKKLSRKDKLKLLGGENDLSLCNKAVHQHIVAEASAHDKEVEEFVVAEIF